MTEEKKMLVPQKGGMSPTGVKTFELVQYVNGYLEGELKDWPANIQDAVMQALERKAREVELPLTIVGSYCDLDYGETKGQDRFFLRIIASEIVVKDTGYEKRMIDGIMRELNGEPPSRKRH